MTLKLYFMKCLERKISQCILPLMVLSDINTVLLRFVIEKSKLSFPFLYLGYIVDNFHPETPAQEVRVNGILNG